MYIRTHTHKWLFLGVAINLKNRYWDIGLVIRKERMSQIIDMHQIFQCHCTIGQGRDKYFCRCYGCMRVRRSVWEDCMPMHKDEEFTGYTCDLTSHLVTSFTGYTCNLTCLYLSHLVTSFIQVCHMCVTCVPHDWYAWQHSYARDMLWLIVTHDRPCMYANTYRQWIQRTNTANACSVCIHRDASIANWCTKPRGLLLQIAGSVQFSHMNAWRDASKSRMHYTCTSLCILCAHTHSLSLWLASQTQISNSRTVNDPCPSVRTNLLFCTRRRTFSSPLYASAPLASILPVHTHTPTHPHTPTHTHTHTHTHAPWHNQTHTHTPARAYNTQGDKAWEAIWQIERNEERETKREKQRDRNKERERQKDDRESSRKSEETSHASCLQHVDKRRARVHVWETQKDRETAREEERDDGSVVVTDGPLASKSREGLKHNAGHLHLMHGVHVANKTPTQEHHAQCHNLPRDMTPKSHNRTHLFTPSREMISSPRVTWTKWVHVVSWCRQKRQS